MVKKTSIKKKGVCVLLTVLFGILGWFYTYKIDSWKLWVSIITIFILAINGVDTYFLYGFSVWAIIDGILKEQEFLDKVYGTY